MEEHNDSHKNYDKGNLQHTLNSLIAFLEEKIGPKRLKEEYYQQSTVPDSAALGKLKTLQKKFKQPELFQKSTLLFREAKMLSILLKRFDYEKSSIIKHLQKIDTERYSAKNLLDLNDYLSKKGKIDTHIIDKVLNANPQPPLPEPTYESSLKFELIDINTLEDSSFKKLVGRTTDVYILNDPEKIQELVTVLQSREWYKNEILKDPYFLFVALAACKQGLISPLQYRTLSQIIEIRKKYGEESLTIHSLIDENGQFTKEAYENLFEYFPKSRIDDIGSFTKNKKNMELLKKNIIQLPHTEQVFFKITVREEESGLNRIFNGFLLNLTSFGSDTFLFKKLRKIAIFSTGAYQSLINLIYPKNAVKLAVRLGPVSPQDIETSLKNEDARVVSTYYPHYKTGKPSQNSHFSHTYFEEDTTQIGEHDNVHAMFASTYPKKQRNFNFECVDTIRYYTNNESSSIIWNLIDHAVHFHSWISLIHLSDPSEYSTKYTFEDLKECWNENNDLKKYSPEIAILLLDMIFLNPKKWTEYGIDKKFLQIEMDKYSVLKQYCHIDYLNDEVFFSRNDPVSFNLLKLNILFNNSFSSIPLNPDEIKQLFYTLDVHKNDLLQNITLKKEDVKEPNTHHVRLYWNGQLLNNDTFLSMPIFINIKNNPEKEVVPEVTGEKTVQSNNNVLPQIPAEKSSENRVGTAEVSYPYKDLASMTLLGGANTKNPKKENFNKNIYTENALVHFNLK